MLSYLKQQKNTISTSVYKTWIHLLVHRIKANTLGFVTLRIGSDEGRSFTKIAHWLLIHVSLDVYPVERVNHAKIAKNPCRAYV